MKVYVQVIDTKTGIYQTGMIEEPVLKGFEIENAIKHFGVIHGEVNWQCVDNCKYGTIKGTTKIISVICV